MTGVPSDPDLKGIIPRSFGQIFKFISDTPNAVRTFFFCSNKKQSPNTNKFTPHFSLPPKQFLVRASYLEIYNEQIRDLLGDDPKKKLDLKQHPQYGVFVKDLTACVVKDDKEMDEVMTRGNSNRAVASTKMNEGSSRSHAIFTVVVEANQKDDKGGDHIRQGKLNLVDLAGSERAGKTEATGERLKEGCAINLSLVALGNVINALVEGKSKHIPYRDSKLTRLLEDSLGGSAKTAMITAIGPADYNYEETLSTLRYASRAKNIKNKPKINEDPKDALLREMQEEIAKLKQELESIGGEGQAALQQVRDLGTAAGIDPVVVEQLRQETDEKIRAVLRDKGVLEEERNKFVQALGNLKQTEQQEKELREAVEMRLRLLEGNICVGGVNLFDENQQIQSKIAEQEAELKRAEEDRKKLQKKLEEHREEDFATEGKYSSLQEEIVGRTEKLKRLETGYEYYKSESASLRREWEVEKSDLLQTVRELTKELKRKQAIMNMFVPEQVQQMLVDNMSRWDPDLNDWTIKAVSLAGNAIKARGSNSGGPSEEEDGGEPSSKKVLINASAVTATKKQGAFSTKSGAVVYLSYSSARPKQVAIAAPLISAPLISATVSRTRKAGSSSAGPK